MNIDMNPRLTEEESEFLDVSKFLREGWQIQDHPQMLKSYWEYFLKAYGEEGKDYHKLSEATYNTEDKGKPVVYMRGQLLLGPNARSNLAEYHRNNGLPE